jgi:hypothetical protein
LQQEIDRFCIKERAMCTGKKVLAVQENFGQVAACDCGTVHVSIGPVSVALDSHSLRNLHNLLGSAVHKMEAMEDGQPESIFFHSAHFESRKVLKLKH